MSDPATDGTQEWVLPERAHPPLLGELVERIDEALATARASEAAVMTVGAAALDAAEQAKRAAELAERASAAIDGRGLKALAMPPTRVPLHRDAATDEDGLSDFTARADRLAARLRQLERLPT